MEILFLDGDGGIAPNKQMNNDTNEKAGSRENHEKCYTGHNIQWAWKNSSPSLFSYPIWKIPT